MIRRCLIPFTQTPPTIALTAQINYLGKNEDVYVFLSYDTEFSECTGIPVGSRKDVDRA